MFLIGWCDGQIRCFGIQMNAIDRQKQCIHKLEIIYILAEESWNMLNRLSKVCAQIILRETLHFFSRSLVICVQSWNADEPFFNCDEAGGLDFHSSCDSILSFCLSFPNHQLNLMAITTFPSRPPSLTSSDEDKQAIAWKRLAHLHSLYLFIYSFAYLQSAASQAAKIKRLMQSARLRAITALWVDRARVRWSITTGRHSTAGLKMSIFFSSTDGFFSVIGRIHL